ncbi:hypothetical protein [Owenweeksia hongkongensis]|uniref:hypothetical protein n=1 Tax=Owenweeksia hongkongensis TaxID=253245 RepID=UPI003A8F65B8
MNTSTVIKKIYVVLLFLILVGCEESDIVKVDFLKSRNLRGQVKSVNTEVFDLQKNEDKLEVGPKINSCYFYKNSITNFNKYGGLTSEMEFSGRGDTLRVVQKEFKSDSSIITTERGLQRKGSEEIVTAFYDDQDSLVKADIIRSNDTGNITWERDKFHRISQRSIFLKDNVLSKIVYEYDQNGHLVKESHYSKDSLPNKAITRVFKEKYLIYESTMDFRDGDTMQFINRYIHYRMDSSVIAQDDFEGGITQYQRISQFYDEDSVLRRRVATPVGSKRYNITIREWDKNGNLIKHKTMESDEKDIFEVTYTYDYDKEGNWLEMKSFANGEPNCVVTRKIEYY